jgi:hypothetical protein
MLYIVTALAALAASHRAMSTLGASQEDGEPSEAAKRLSAAASTSVTLSAPHTNQTSLGVVGGWHAGGVVVLPPAPPYTFPEVASCSLSGQTRRIAFVHIAKTGGSTLASALIANGINFTQVNIGLSGRAAALVS